MGTRTATGNISVSVQGTPANALSADDVSVSVLMSLAVNEALTSGTGASNTDRVWQDKGRSLAVGTEDIDVFDFAGEDVGAGAGLDALGQAITLAEIMCIFVRNRSTNGAILDIGGKSATTAWNSLFVADDDAKLRIHPTGFACIGSVADPAYAVADTTNHLLTMTASVATVTYDIMILGRSA